MLVLKRLRRCIVGYGRRQQAKKCNVNLPRQSVPRSSVQVLVLVALLLLLLTGGASCRMLALPLASTTRLALLAPRLLSAFRPGVTAPRANGRQQLMAAAASTAAAGAADKPRVIVVTGPTAVGKSSLALALCQELQGEIISVDSVQVYRRLDIGSNKPSAEERAAVRHHLLDVLDPDAEEAFTAGDFVRRAEAAIDDALQRGRMPVVVGGTSMYTQWLVQGRPDAPRSDPEMEARARAMLAPFQAHDDWEGALALLAQRHPQRAAQLSPNDWYRLERALEVSLQTAAAAAGGENGDEAAGAAFTGVRRSAAGEKYDLRCFFLIAPREPLCHLIDQRCLQMAERGLLEETAELLASGALDPSSPPGRAIGYRQAIEYLQRADVADVHAEEAALRAFLQDFATATRRYAKQQMVWYRAQPEFVWVRWDLQDLAPAKAALRACYEEEAAAHAERRLGQEQAALREENLQEGKRMKRYVSTVLTEAENGGRLDGLVRRAWACRQKLREATGAAAGQQQGP